MDTITIRMNGNKTMNVEGHKVKGFGIYKDVKGHWYITDLATGMNVIKTPYATLKDAKSVGLDEAKKNLTNAMVTKPDAYADLVTAFNKIMGKDDTAKDNKESEGKKMAKTNTKAKAEPKKSAPKKSASKAKSAPKDNALEKENKALKKELEILKKQLEELTRIEKVNIDSFDVEHYMATRDNSDRITPELVEALENTDGLVVTRKGDDKWLYVSGKTEADTKERKEIFKAMGFRWSAPEKAWFIAPYPLRNKKAWGAKKARKASANA